MALLLPSAAVDRVTDISVELLRILGVEAVLLDVDNTLAAHGSQIPFPGSIEWSCDLRNAGIKMVILSNNTKKRIAPFAARYGLPFLSFCMKPLPFSYLRAIKKLKVHRKATAIVGDQIFTDVVGANFCRMKSILLTPVIQEQSFSFRVRRKMEKAIRRSIDEKGLTAENICRTQNKE